MKNFGIKNQLMITTLIPILLVAILFAFFYNAQFKRNLDQHITRLGQAYIRQLLPAAQLALLRKDNRTLQALVDASTINPEIQSLAFYNAQGQLLSYRGGKHFLNEQFSPPGYTGDFIEHKKLNAYEVNFISPITIPKFNLYSYIPIKKSTRPNALQADNILGWLTIDIDTKTALIKKYQMYLVTAFITFFGLMIGLLIHSFLAKNIHYPIARLRRSMKQILSSEFETVIKTTSHGEIGTIERGCSHLQRHYLEARQDLNQYIEIATSDLQKNLELLEVKNVELTIEKKKTEEKSRQKSEFIANMSHEVRTPMNAIIGFSNILQDSKLDSLQLDYVKTIRSSAEDLLTIINDILDYSKMDAGKLKLDAIPMDIRACIDDVFALMAHHAHKKDIDLIPATERNVPKTVLGDPLRLKQIISNLVSNAIKFTDKGYVLVRTKIEKETEKTYHISLTVSDTGIGIAKLDQANLFNAFSQAENVIAKSHGGTGLGLVICKKLAEHMHGKITLKSELHKGSTFKVDIVLAKLIAYEVEKNQIHRFSNLKAICYDDNPLYLETLCNGLGNWGIQCIEVKHFNELTTAYRHHTDAHIAFINVNKGCEAQISEVIKTSNIASVLMSKWPVENYQALGAQAFIFKPANIKKLHDIIESLIHKKTSITHRQENLERLPEELQKLSPKILIAEDNAVNRKLFSSLLKNKNISIDEVTDGQDALTICNKKTFDSILLDLHMPKMDGLKAAQLIRSQSLFNKATPIILISASQFHDSDVLSKNGITRCLEKPILPQTLYHTLIQVIKKNQHQPAIHWDECLKKVGNNQSLARDYLHAFVEELPAVLSSLKTAINQSTIDDLTHVLHKLKGASCFCGVPNLIKEIINFEQQLHSSITMHTKVTHYNKIKNCIELIIKEYNQRYSTLA